MKSKSRKNVAGTKRAVSNHLHKDLHFGKAKLKPAVKGPTAGRYPEMLKEDRGIPR